MVEPMAEERFTFSVMTEAEVDEVTDAFSLAFLHGEPLTERCLGFSLRDHQNFTRLFTPRMGVEGLTILARDKRGRIAGGFLNSDLSAENPAGLKAVIDAADGNLPALVAAIGELDDFFIDAFQLDSAAKERPELLPKGRFFHLWMLLRQRVFLLELMCCRVVFVRVSTSGGARVC
ncbi:unnamed protein product [Effrenium voratum]|nr:unnamed protein product [Effrenium voratum]